MHDVECLIDTRQLVSFGPAMKKSTSKQFLTITEAAEKLGVKRQAIHAAIKKGHLKAVRGKITHTRIVKTTVNGWKVDVKSLETYRKK